MSDDLAERNAELFSEVAAAVAEAAAIEPGMDVLDVTPELAAGVLALDDASVDRVLSTFGMTAAPSDEVIAAELVRICRPGGMIVLADWTADSAMGGDSRWGDEAYLRALLGGQILLAMERRSAEASSTGDDGDPIAADYLLVVGLKP